MRKGRKSAAQTKAPPKDRIKGSNINKKGSASSTAKASTIVLSNEIIESLSKKAKEFNEKHKQNKVSLSTLKAVFRRGAGAFSTSHRPNMTRNGWAYARVNKFLEKKSGKKVKAAYVQDDDLMENGGKIQDNGLLSSIYPEIKQIFADNGLIINEDYSFTDGSNKSFLAHIGMQKSADFVEKVAITYYGYGFEVLGEVVIEIDLNGQIDILVEFPNWQVYEKIQIMKKGGKLKSAKSLATIAKEKGVTITYAFNQLKKGMEFEKEHSDDKKVQKTIALQHLDENIDYYKKLAKMEASFGRGGQTFNDKELLARYKKGESIGFTAIAHLKAKGLIPRADGTKRKSEKYMENGGEVDLLQVGQVLHLRRLPMYYRSGDLGKQREVYKKVVEVISKESWTDEEDDNENRKNKTKYYFKADDKKMYSATFWGEDLISVNSDTVRYEAIDNPKMKEGGELSQEVTCHNCGWHWNTNESEEYDKYVCHKCGFDNKLFYSNNIMEKGGQINADDPKIKSEIVHKSGKVGGLLVGKRHSEGGIKAINKSNNSPLEMEGGEVVITRNAVSDDTKREFEGEMLTNRQILSKINEGGGGVSFAEGGDIPEHIMVSGKEYKYGGKTLKDSDIVDYCGCKHKMSKGGEVKSILIINKSVPSYIDFKNNNKNINLHTSKSDYKKHLKNKYKVEFEHLPNMIQMGLLLGNQKLVDNYINA
jgi:hypothetical protein